MGWWSLRIRKRENEWFDEFGIVCTWNLPFDAPIETIEKLKIVRNSFVIHQYIISSIYEYDSGSYSQELLK